MAKLVLVDDNEDILELLETVAGFDGFEVEKFVTGGEAFNYIEKEKPLALITDFNVPGINGVELCIKTQSLYSHVPCFIISGEPSDVLAEAGCPKSIGILGKPFDTTKIMDILKKL